MSLSQSRITRRRHIPAALVKGACAAGACLVMALPVHAGGCNCIAEQLGMVYLLLNVAQDQKLVEKHGKKDGSLVFAIVHSVMWLLALDT
jgi:hypothetical protein